MSDLNFPQQNVIFKEKPFSRDMLASAFADIFSAGTQFHGFLQVDADDGILYFLFFLRGNPYAAGRIAGHKPSSLSITDFLFEILTFPPETLLVSLYQTDPVLLKSMLVFLQEEPTAKVPVNLIDMEQIVRQIRAEEGDALIILEKAGNFNFYFFKSGKAALSHLADGSFTPPADLSVEEQMLLYALDAIPPLPTAYIYRNIATEQASDAEQITREMLTEMLARPTLSREVDAPLEPEDEVREITVEILGKAEKGILTTVTLPCTVGRKECDLVIQDGLVSRKHAVIFEDDAGDIFIEDLKSTNGTFVNGRKVESEQLNYLDTVTVGGTSFRISS